MITYLLTSLPMITSHGVYTGCIAVYVLHDIQTYRSMVCSELSVLMLDMAVLTSVQNATMFTALLPMICACVGPVAVNDPHVCIYYYLYLHRSKGSCFYFCLLSVCSSVCLPDYSESYERILVGHGGSLCCSGAPNYLRRCLASRWGIVTLSVCHAVMLCVCPPH